MKILNYHQKYIEVLNNLVEINNSRIEGYSLAAKETPTPTIRYLFSKLAETSLACRHELCDEIKRIGGMPDEGPIRAGKIFWLWCDLKAEDTNIHRLEIFESCECGEQIAHKAYEEALHRVEEILPDCQDLIKKQYDMIQADNVKIINLKRVFVKAA